MIGAFPINSNRFDKTDATRKILELNDNVLILTSKFFDMDGIDGHRYFRKLKVYNDITSKFEVRSLYLHGRLSDDENNSRTIVGNKCIFIKKLLTSLSTCASLGSQVKDILKTKLKSFDSKSSNCQCQIDKLTSKNE